MKEVNLNKTLEQLEKQNRSEPVAGDTSLISKTHLLRKKQLKDFTVEDLRLMIGQSFSLGYLIPLAIGHLKENILAEGDLYAGDLFNSVLHSDANYWIEHKDQWTTIVELYEESRQTFESDNTYRQIRKSFQQFAQIQ